jgi:uncharacterized membrane protein
MNRTRACLPLTILTLLYAPGAVAYVGPTLGLGVVGTVLAVIAVALLSLAAFVIMPIRRMMKKSKKKSASAESDPARRP